MKISDTQREIFRQGASLLADVEEVSAALDNAIKERNEDQALHNEWIFYLQERQRELYEEAHEKTRGRP